MANGPRSMGATARLVGSGAVLLMAACLPAAAGGEPGGYRPAERHGAPRLHRRHARPHLPPEIAYRDPRLPPPTIVRAYMPRNHAVPLYNEPPTRFPQP